MCLFALDLTVTDGAQNYRESRNIPLGAEHKIMTKTVTNFDNLTLIQKVQIFQKALEQSDGKDLERVLWLKVRALQSTVCVLCVRVCVCVRVSVTMFE